MEHIENTIRFLPFSKIKDQERYGQRETYGIKEIKPKERLALMVKIDSDVFNYTLFAYGKAKIPVSEIYFNGFKFTIPFTQPKISFLDKGIPI